ncbi:MAG: hypothetical protein IJB96_03740 [Lachnospira sp.]|nr:hypothetical protein [Lachnospira sp.]
MKRKMLKAVLLVSLVAGCVGCGNKEAAQAPENNYPTIDFLCDNEETKTGSMDGTVTEVVNDSMVGTIIKNNNYSSEETETKAAGGYIAETEAGKEPETKGSSNTVSNVKEKETVKQNTTQSTEQHEYIFEEDVTMSAEMESAWKEYMEAMKEAEKYAMKYEVSEAGIANVKTFEKTELTDNNKKMYPNARAWKNKACNIAIIDDTKNGVTFTVDVKIGKDRIGSKAYVMTFKFSNGREEVIEFDGKGTWIISFDDSFVFSMGEGTAKNLDLHVK